MQKRSLAQVLLEKSTWVYVTPYLGLNTKKDEEVAIKLVKLALK
jgi:hypothetical protein